MTMMLLEHPVTGACLLPPTTGSMTLRLNALARDISGLVEPSAATRDPAFTGCVLMPWAGIVLAGTTCRRPILFNEGEALARILGWTSSSSASMLSSASPSTLGSSDGMSGSFVKSVGA